MADIAVNWEAFNNKFSGKAREAFERLAYTLFCFEFKRPYGILCYFNQPYIETSPIAIDKGDIVGFQAKYYDAATPLSSRKAELIDAIKGTLLSYPKLNKFIIYTNKDLNVSSTKNKTKPSYQREIESCGENLGIQVE